ncbi:MAG: type I methionyl aminopeptidase [Erysipelotrichaceae bacterium]|jgi:methionyl aminopeptidase|nr:type I methionyl aminopeptidase [Erysipelotrichaceae bacterium]
MIIVKSDREIALMRVAGKIVASVFKTLEPHLKPGISTQELDEIAEKTIRDQGAYPTFKGYGGFPGAICISVNETLVHGIPSKKIILKEGDIVSLDVGATYQGYCGDACRTYPVGKISEKAAHLIKTTEESFWYGLKKIHEGAFLGTVSHAIQEYNEKRGYSLPRDYTGHGIGSHLHEDPSIPNYGKAETGPILLKGMTLAIEPMVAMGNHHTRVLPDGWTVKMRDGKLSAHYENTIVVTKDGYEVLTTYEGEKINNV